ncbi:MAG: hypothetical protein WDM79_18665 [Terricaulis sp.]
MSLDVENVVHRSVWSAKVHKIALIDTCGTVDDRPANPLQGRSNVVDIFAALKFPANVRQTSLGSSLIKASGQIQLVAIRNVLSDNVPANARVKTALSREKNRALPTRDNLNEVITIKPDIEGDVIECGARKFFRVTTLSSMTWCCCPRAVAEYRNNRVGRLYCRACGVCVR